MRAVLAELFSRPGMSMDELTEHLGAGSTKQAMQATVRRLERKGLLTRELIRETGKPYPRVICTLRLSMHGEGVVKALNTRES